MAFIKEINKKKKNFWVDWLDTVHSWQFTFVVTLDLRYHWAFSCYGFLQLLFAQLQQNNNCINEINCACTILQHAIFSSLGTKCDVKWHLRYTEVASRAPHQFAWAGLSLSCRKKKVVFNHTPLFTQRRRIACECGYTRITFAIVTMLGTPEDTIQSKTGAVSFRFLSLCVF